MDAWAGRAELHFGSAGGGSQGKKSSDCLLRLEAEIMRRLQSSH